ncbi:putative Closca [Daphnia magna]|uniref:Putative Closca n=1 Tax=Daphnia magna TaxID=35525 RepID=A0A0P5AYD0_9CRUS|nr:putative Closca [Daphnia magna]
MVKAFSKALLYSALPILCCIVSCLSQSHLRPSSSDAIKGSEKFGTFSFPSVAEQVKKLHHTRTHRQIDFEKLQQDHSDVWVVQGFKNWRGCPRAVQQFKVFRNSAVWYAVIATNAAENNTEIYSFTAERGCEKLLETLPTRLAFDFEIVRTNDVFRIIVLEKNPLVYPHKRSGSSVYILTFATDLTVSAIRSQVLRNEEPTCITSWEQFGIPHVAICNGKKRDSRGIDSDWTKSDIYCASESYFDQCGAIETHFPKAIRHFRIFSKHYLAVANYPNETVAEDVPTEILRYDLRSKMYQQLQFLPTKGATDLCFLNIGTGLNTIHFLVVVNQLAFNSTGAPNNNAISHVYKFVGEKFEPFQSIQLNSKKAGCLTYQMEDDKSAVVFSMSWGAEVYQYNGWRFVSVLKYSEFALGPGITRLGTLQMNGKTFITVANSNPDTSDKDNLFLPFFSSQLNSTLSTIYKNSLSSCNQMITELEVDPSKLIVDLYPQAVKKNDSVIQLGNVNFNTLSADRVWTNEVELKSNGSSLGASQIFQLKKFAIKMDDMGKKLQALSTRVKLAIRTSGDYAIHGRVHFDALVSNCKGGPCILENVRAKTVNSEDIANTYQQAVQQTDKSIPSLKTRRIEVLQGLPINTTSLSGHDTKDYLTIDDDLKFQNRMKIKGNLLVNGHVNVKGQVDGHSISPNTLLLRQGNQHFNWTLKVNEVRLKTLKTHLINGRNISYLYQNAISSTTNFSFPESKLFSSLAVSKLQLSGLVNKVNLTNLDKNSMKLSGNQVVNGIHRYTAAHLGRAVLNGSFNGKQFPTDFISIQENNKLKLKTLQLTHDTKLKRLTITDNVAGIPVANGRWGTNLFNKSSNELQLVTGKKKFGNLKSKSDVFSKTLNQLPMDVFNTTSSLYGQPENLLIYDSLAVEGDVIFEKPLSISDTEGVGIKMLQEKGIILSTKDFPPIRSLTVTSNVMVKRDLSTVKLNGVPSGDIFTKDRKTPITFNGRKEFNNTISLNHTFTLLYTLNGFDLRDLWKQSLKIEGDQMLSGSLLIKNDVDVVKLKAQNSQLVPMNSPTLGTGSKHFRNLTIEKDWFVDALEVTGLFNEVDVSSWPSDTILKTGNHQTITSQKSLLSLKVKDVEVAAVDDLDVNQFLDVVLIDEPIIVHSNVILSGPFSSEKVVVTGTIDGVHSNAPLNWLRYEENQTIPGNMEIRGTLDVADLRQNSWMVNAVDLNLLLKEAVRTDDSRHFSSIEFGHLVIDDLLVEGFIQGHNVTEELIRKHSGKDRQSILGLKSFSGPLVSDSFRVVKDINGFDPKRVCETPIPPQTSNWVVFGNVLFKRGAKLNASKINDRMLNETMHNLWLKEAKIDIKSKQNFTSVIVNGIFPEKVISNVSFSDLNLRAVKLSSSTDQNVTAFHKFLSIEASGFLAVESLNSSRINEIDISQITSSVLLRDTEQNITNRITFQDVVASNVTVNGLLNGVDVSTSMMRSDRDNIITGRKSVMALHVQEALEMCNNCSVGTYDISNWASRAVLHKGNFTLSGAKFESLVFQQPLNLKGTLNNVSLSRDLVLTLSDQQEINGRLSISSLLPDDILYSSEQGRVYQQATEEFSVAARFTNLQVNGLYDGIALRHFYDQAVRRDTDVKFSEPVILSVLVTESLQDFSGNSTIRDIIKLPLNVSHHVAASPVIQQEIRQRSLSSMVQNIKRVVSRQNVELRFFEEVAVPRSLPPVVDDIFAWETAAGEIELCSYVEKEGALFYGYSSSPLLKDVEVTGVASLRTAEGFAVAALDRSRKRKHDSFIFSPLPSDELDIQIIPTDFPIGATAFLLANSSCYLFLEKTSKTPIYCRLLGSNANYTLVQHLPIVDARLVTVGYHYKTGLPLLSISTVGQRGYGYITIWNFNVMSQEFEPWKTIVTLQIIALDCICNEAQCLLVTVAPSKPAAIPGQVIIWRLNDIGPPTRLQRIAFSEPIDAKFARLPDGRLALMVLQSSGVDNVYVYVWRGIMQFQHETTIRAPGAHGLQPISNNVQLILALAVSSEVPFGPVRMFRAQFLGQLN